MEVQITAAALDDIERIEMFIAESNPRRAHKVVKDLFDKMRSLRQFPRRGRVVPELSDAQLRELIVDHHRILYEINDGAVYVLTVLHGRQSFPFERFLED